MSAREQPQLNNKGHVNRSDHNWPQIKQQQKEVMTTQTHAAKGKKGSKKMKMNWYCNLAPL